MFVKFLISFYFFEYIADFDAEKGLIQRLRVYYCFKMSETHIQRNCDDCRERQASLKMRDKDICPYVDSSPYHFLILVADDQYEGSATSSLYKQG